MLLYTAADLLGICIYPHETDANYKLDCLSVPVQIEPDSLSLATLTFHSLTFYSQSSVDPKPLIRLSQPHAISQADKHTFGGKGQNYILLEEASLQGHFLHLISYIKEHLTKFSWLFHIEHLQFL